MRPQSLNKILSDASAAGLESSGTRDKKGSLRLGLGGASDRPQQGLCLPFGERSPLESTLFILAPAPSHRPTQTLTCCVT